MRDRTVILVSHHVQLCAPGASYVVALDNGQLQFAGGRDDFLNSSVIKTLVQSMDRGDAQEGDIDAVAAVPTVEDIREGSNQSEASSTVAPTPAELNVQKKVPRKLVEEEKRAVGRIGKDIWATYVWASGGRWYWAFFIFVMVVACLSPVIENSWLR